MPSPPSPSARWRRPIVHLVYGSPGGRPTESRIKLALAELGVFVDDLAPAAMQSAGVVLFEGSDRHGPLLVKVYGRDAWDAQLLTSLWRTAWYRGGERGAGRSRVDLVEHEGFVTLLAERAGVRVPRLVTAGSAGRGDALVVVRPEGMPLAATLGDVATAIAAPPTSISRRCGTTSAGCTTPASSTAGSTSTASSPIPTAHSASAICRRRRSPRNPAPSPRIERN